MVLRKGKKTVVRSKSIKKGKNVGIKYHDLKGRQRAKPRLKIDPGAVACWGWSC